MSVESIDITNQFDRSELEFRLREVSLRGFPDVKIWGTADIDVVNLTPKLVKDNLFTPQPSVYRPELDKVEKVAELFREQGVDIFSLNGGVDYTAEDSEGEATEWTMIPPVVEVLPFEFDNSGKIVYSDLIGEDLKKLMAERGYDLNPELKDLDYDEYKRNRGGVKRLSEICDGSHRIEVGIRKGINQNVLFMERMVPGFPYYAAPKPYSTVHEEPERIEERLDKTHVLTSPGHKLLYRLFPSGGIKSGNVRPLKQNYD